MKTLKLALLIVTSLMLTFCGNDKKSNTSDENIEIIEVDTKPETKIYPEPALTATFNDKKIGAAYEQYSKLQNALVNTNAAAAAMAATQLSEALNALNAEEKLINAVVSTIASSNIEHQRKEFVVITAEMEKILADALESGTIYKSYCPMAFKNNGAYWLSSGKEIQNPYFGDKMMRCGRVDSTIE